MGLRRSIRNREADDGVEENAGLVVDLAGREPWIRRLCLVAYWEMVVNGKWSVMLAPLA